MGSGDFAILDERFRPLVKVTARIEKLYEGCRWAEGPAYFPAQRSLVWSDIPNDRMLRFDEATGETGVFRQPAGYSNGNTVDREGRLVTCEHGNRRVTRTEHDGSITVLAERFEGKRLNSPNDVVVRSDGSIWFTDPSYGIDSDYEGHKAESEIGACNVYRVDPASGAIRIVADDFVRPNGLAFSPDERLLYVADTGVSHVKDGPQHIRVFRVADDGKLSGGEVFATCTDGRLRRLPARRGGAHLVERRRRRALPRAGRDADRQGAGAGAGRERRLRRPEAQPPLHLRHDLALRGARRGERREDVLMGFVIPGGSAGDDGTTPTTADRSPQLASRRDSDTA